MHSDLSLHLHTDDCAKIIQLLQQCHENHKLGKFFGKCNDIDRSLVKCLRKERQAKQAINYKKSLEKREAALKRKLEEEKNIL